MMPVILGLAMYLGPLGAIAVCDIKTLRAPNRYVYPLFAIAVSASLTVYRPDALEALLGGLLAFGLLTIVAIAGRGAMGFGDVKYGVVCGIAVGLYGVIPMLVCAFVLGGVAAVAVLATRLRSRDDAIAFTPFMFAGVLFALAWAQPYLVT